ncbi:MAG: transcription elongation factor GreAB [Comamonadaceae bacterium]|nr:MAG: transcription elongation factor GreAB [Comamonadaceae bacterium]
MQAGLPVLADTQFTELDFRRLSRLAAAHAAGELAETLDLADVVPGRAIDASVVTMYSQFELEDEGTHERRTLSICYPPDAQPATGFISVLSPMGRSLIGRRAGAQVRWSTPGGEHSGRIGAVLFQPEASGDYVT